MSGDAEQQYFCDGITEDITTELEHLLRGDALPVGTPEIEAESRLHFEKAIELDPGYARAHALLSFSLEQEWYRDMSDSNRLRDEAFDMACKAVTLDENDALCHLAMLWAHVDRHAYELAEQHLAKALALNPNQPERNRRARKRLRPSRNTNSPLG